MPHYVATIRNDGEDIDYFFFDSIPQEFPIHCEAAILKTSIRTSRKDKREIPITISQLIIDNGNMFRKSITVINTPVPFREMTPTEFNEEIKIILKEIPKEFHAMVRELSINKNGSLDESFEYAKEIVEKLKPSIELFLKHIRAAVK